jgi:DNA primase
MNTDLLEIKNRLNIVDVLGEYLRLEKAGTNWRANCPFHNEKSPSFMVSEEKQIWHCFGCQKGGDVFSFVMEMEGLEFREALKILADKAGVKLQNFNPEKQKKESRTLEILELATKFYEIQLWKGEGTKKILNYLENRGFSEKTIKNFRLGYAPKGWRNALTFLEKRGYSVDEISQTGLLVEKKDAQGSGNILATNQKLPASPAGGSTKNYYDRFRDRIMFPIADYSGRIIGFSARVAPGGDETQAKYVNTPESDVYHKSQALYGLDKAKSEIKKKDFVLLVEGNADVIAASQAGIENVVAVSGTALTETQVGILKRYTKNVKMFFDMDTAGENATKKSLKLCIANGMNVRIVSIPAGKDAADAAREDKNNFLLSVEKALPATEHFFEKIFSRYDKKNVEGKKKITDDIFEIIKDIPDEIEKNHWIKKLSEGLEIAESILTDRLRKAILESRMNISRFSKKEKTEEEPEEIGSRKEIILDKIIGLALISKEVWQEIAKNDFFKTNIPEDELFKFILDSGEKLKFNFDNLINNLQGEKTKKRLEKLFFENKFQLGLNNEVEEIVVENPLGDLRRNIKELRIESKKEELEKLIRDLKFAQEKGDRMAEMFLREESKRISQELGELV